MFLNFKFSTLNFHPHFSTTVLYHHFICIPFFPVPLGTTVPMPSIALSKFPSFAQCPAFAKFIFPSHSSPTPLYGHGLAKSKFAAACRLTILGQIFIPSLLPTSSDLSKNVGKMRRGGWEGIGGAWPWSTAWPIFPSPIPWPCLSHRNFHRCLQQRVLCCAGQSAKMV